MKENRIINSVMFGITIAVFIILIFMGEKQNQFNNSFLENLFLLLLIFVGSFFIGNIVIGIPIALIHYITNHTFEDFYEISAKKRFLFVSVFLIFCCIILALIVT